MSKPQPPNWPLRIMLASIIAVFLVCLVWSMAYQFSGPSSSTASDGNGAGNAPAASVVDQQDVAKYWDENFRGASWYGITAMPTWDGTWLSAKTGMVADADAKSPAVSICGALSSYFVSSGKEFQSVRVLDKDGNVMVSRHTLSDQCVWRR